VESSDATVEGKSGAVGEGGNEQELIQNASFSFCLLFRSSSRTEPSESSAIPTSPRIPELVSFIKLLLSERTITGSLSLTESSPRRRCLLAPSTRLVDSPTSFPSSRVFT